MLTVCIADDAKLMREKMRVVTRKNPNLNIVAEFDNGQDALAYCLATPPDLLLSDVQMSGLTGVECADAMTKAACPTKIVLCTSMGQNGIIQNYPSLIKPFAYAQMEVVLWQLFGAALNVN